MTLFARQWLSIVGCLALSVALIATATAAQEPSAQEPAAAAKIQFARQVLPILSSKCFVCHGPDTKDPDMLRLDSFDEATADRGGYRAIDPASPQLSAALLRIHDANDPMPPADAEEQLSEQERQILTAWIEQGGEYALHWAFVPPIKSELPDDDSWRPRAAIDQFISADLRKQGLEFAPIADRATLARRAALVLTGLPPEPEVLAAYLADESEQAYERLVDRLLADPRYGEHQARYWLDATRYGDTHGLHLDNRRGIYPYRDWVVRSFNEGLPLDRFIEWQIAGDLLPEPELEQLIATGFVRMNPTTAEGGAIPDEFQAKNNFDRTETFGTVLLGMTLTCARCHTHKYDPITQHEYYQLLAFFNSTAEPPLDSNAYAFGPVVEAPTDQDAWYAWEQLEFQIEDAASSLDVDFDTYARWVEQAKSMSQWKASEWRISDAIPADQAEPTAEQWHATDKLPGIAPNRTPDPQQAVWIECVIDSNRAQTLWLTYRSTQQESLWLGGAELSANDAAAQETVVVGGLKRRRIDVPEGAFKLRIKLVGDGNPANLEVLLENPWQAVTQAASWQELKPVQRLFIAADPQSGLVDAEQRKKLLELGLKERLARRSFTTTLVAKELPQPRPTRVLRRGEYDLPVGDPVEPGIPAAIGGWPTDAPRNRLGLAQWLVSAENPLVTRVLVNSFWQRTFGYGLVRTPEDFGLQGSQPTHPELLDWLAVDLRESGWDMKRLLREMVLSRTFMQESRRRSDVDDPENRLFARGLRQRMDAEMLRDLGLWASGLLDPHMGGEGVKPYQPEGMWLALAHPGSNTKDYTQDHGDRLYRRSLYVYWKRTSPHPVMTIFDAPDRESSCVRRSRTNTALQSLAMFNETQRIEIARSFAQRLLQQTENDSQRLTLLYQLLACRAPTEQEAAICLDLVAKMRDRYAADPEAARALVSIGEAPRDDSLSAVEHAAWTQLATVVLASDIGLMVY